MHEKRKQARQISENPKSYKLTHSLLYTRNYV